MSASTTAAKDVLLHARFERGRLQLRGRTGVFDVAARDGFYLRRRELELLPRTWAKLVSDGPHPQYAFVEWPDPVRDGGSRDGRLAHYQREVFVPRRLTPLEADVDPATAACRALRAAELPPDLALRLERIAPAFVAAYVLALEAADLSDD